MLQSEFEERVKMSVSPKEYNHIEAVYIASDVDKDTFCWHWRQMNKERVKAAAESRKEAERKEELKTKLWAIIEKYSSKGWQWTNNHYTNALTEREQNTCKQAGLNIRFGCNDYKLMSTILYDIKTRIRTI